MAIETDVQWDALLTAQEVADLARIHVITFYLWCKRGQGPRPTRLGSVIRYKQSDVRKWVASGQGREEVA